MRVAEEFTPEVLLSAPRRGAAVPSPDGTLILYTQSTHSFEYKKTLNEVRVMHVETGASDQLTDDGNVHDALWMPGTASHVIYLKSGDKGTTQIWIANAADLAEEHYVAAEYDAPLSALKVKALADGSVAFVVAGLVGPDGSLFNDEAEEKTSTGRIFDDYHVRIWNTLYKSHKHALWYSTLVNAHGKWGVAGELQNAIKDTSLEAPWGMYDVADPAASFDISEKGIAFIAEDTGLSPEQVGISHVYYVPLRSFAAAADVKPRPIVMGISESKAYYTNVRCSPDGSKIAFLHASYSTFADARLYIGYTASFGAYDVHKMVFGKGPRLPPRGFEFAGSSDAIFLLTEDCGRVKLSHLELRHGAEASPLVQTGVVTAVYPLKEGSHDKVLVTSNSIVDSSLWQVIDVSLNTAPRVVSSATRHGAKYGLSHSMISEFWYEGADDAVVHSFIIKPSNFDKTKKYPWILLPHGGPEASWLDSWSTRWNMALWAQKGYVLIAPNIAGSTGYGSDFTARIYRSWGGAPYQDLVALMDHLQQVPYLDHARAIVAGASYGGYMISWMMGHDLIRRFSCAIWHDGIFNLPAFMIQSDLVDGGPDFGGPPFIWRNAEELERWNPARPELLRNWRHAPPTLVIHSEKDYRCPITEGIAAFNTLQCQGVKSRFLTFSDECHWVLNPENSILWHQTVFDWMARYAGETTVVRRD
ncbi:prolyl oligopeptidase [Colletotrichum higginsianum]|uniref:Dipeptidyl-peptidase V n=2 Tax=Colletotrichum higginsianum TaxID=80884 RepID=H1W104_COLHI|nr:Prolyl oligopeptidase [Colletotrichum higginsianum IMI 349063]OBR02374.1 Prolyl oligopeptidase [Colletotrichum higginsianum IMI 349063]TID07499.1 Dipeptidyl-peptidase 5 [Colletotrichum higginsianum]CCF46167.1 prolyl oligopeptidase [Colletotrichum higginsianum]